VEYKSQLEEISLRLRSDAATLALMLLYVDRQIPSCVELQRRLQFSMQPLFAVVARLWEQVLSATLTVDMLANMRKDVSDLGSISNLDGAQSSLPTIGVALNTCDAVLKIIDFLSTHRKDSFVLCAQNCMEAVREEIYQEKHLQLVATKGAGWVSENRSSIEYAGMVELIAQSAFLDERTQIEIETQLDLAESVLRIAGDNSAALWETRGMALTGGENSLGFKLGS
jgi:hypothetical protein